jgi:murein DD-endopeptidase MepM/ murein hydrolase activator NlpD
MKYLAFAVCLGLAAPVRAEEYRLPFDGRWFVMQGGDTLNVNHHMAVRAQRYGVDFAKVDGPGGNQLGRGNLSKVEDFYSWGESVRSPTAGEVVAVVNDKPDNPLGKKDPKNPGGNYVVMQTSSGQFVFVAHLQRGSVRVGKGQTVKLGQELGLCGNSGNSDFPHVHMHVQDTADLTRGEGKNMTFGSINVELSGKRFSGVAWPLIRGLFVENSAPNPPLQRTVKLPPSGRSPDRR